MKKLPRAVKMLVVAVLSFQLAACGTIMHPDRKGQKDGRIDAGVAILDGLGLLFFIIPGVIAYAVDFSNGTIYLPEGGVKKTAIVQPGLISVPFDPKHWTPESLKFAIFEQTGYTVDWRDPRLKVISLKDTDEIPAYFARR